MLKLTGKKIITILCSKFSHTGPMEYYDLFCVNCRAEHKSLEMEEECCICMENVPKIILPCAHRFCERCVDAW